MSKNYGVYICTGCGIGEALDSQKMIDVAGEKGVTAVTHECLCGDAGLEFLNKAVNDGVNFMSIAACSRRVNFDVFKWDNVMVDRVAIRENVAWTISREKYTTAC